MKWIGGGIPYGYSYDHETKKLIINSDEAKIVKYIYQLASQDEGIKSITNLLNQQGAKTRYGKNWNITLVKGILFRYKFYQGIGYDGTRGNWDTLIDDKTARIIARKFFHTSSPKNKLITRQEYLLSAIGILKCGYCGGSVKAVVVKKANNVKFHYYLCTNKQTGGVALCRDSKLVSMSLIDNLVLTDAKVKVSLSNKILTYIKQEKKLMNDKIKSMLLSTTKLSNNDNIVNDLDLLQQQISQTKDKLNSITEPVSPKGRSKRNFILSNINAIKIYSDYLIIQYKYPIDNKLNHETKIVYEETT